MTGIEIGIVAFLALLASLVGSLAVRRRSVRAALPGPVDIAAAAEPTAPSLSAGRLFFDGLSRSRAALGEALSGILGRGTVDEAALQALEDALITSDVGVRAAMELTAEIRRAGEGQEEVDLRRLLADCLRQRLGEPEPMAALRSDGPLAILVVGVNGSGKTTTIGKLAARYRRAGHSVLLGAGDTFRAGAIEQLKVWGTRADAPVVAHQEGADPSAVIFDALTAAKARDVDVVICDTAGRLQARRPLMEELGKVVRTMDKALPGAPHEVLLVLDGTIGQNALSQAKEFGKVVGLTGVALTKLDGTARGGVVIAVREEAGVPVKLVGLGEGIDDLRDFDPDAFVDALLGEDEHGVASPSV